MSTSENRQLAAIMFTDIVGYTALMQRNEDEAIQLRNRHREVFDRLHKKFEGEIIQYFGDGTLSTFSSSVQAVLCAIALQQELLKEPKVPLRIGIHSGDILRRREEIIGDGVNVASRIESLAVSGSILISEHLRYQIKNQDITTISLGKSRFKNVLEPIEVFAVVAEGLIIPDIRNPNSVAKGSNAKNRDGESNSIAILPFVNMSNDDEQEYFCDGITEDIINSLSHLQNLKVIARTSAFAFKNKNEDVRKIGRELNVRNLLEGSVRKAGNRLRVTSQLIDATDGSRFWSEKYDRELKDVFEIQDEISMAIVDALKIELFASEKQRVLNNQTNDVEAYSLYLRGQFEWYRRTKVGMQNSIRFFERTLQIDPNHTLAQIGIASAYIAMCDWGVMLPREALPKAHDILQSALGKNPQLAETHAFLAHYHLCTWNPAGYYEHYEQGLKLNPKLPFIHHLDTVAGSVFGTFDRAIQSSQIARSLDPLSLIFNFSVGYTYFQRGDYRQAIDQFKYVLSLDQRFKPASLLSMYCYIQIKQFENAVNAFNSILYGNPESAKYVPLLSDIFNRLGMPGALRWIIDHGLKFYDRPYNRAYHTATCHALLDEDDQVFEHLESLYDIGSFRLTFVKACHLFSKYDENPRFQALVNKIGIWN